MGMYLSVSVCVRVSGFSFFWRFISHFHRPSQLWRTWRLLISVNHLPFHLLPLSPSLSLSLPSSSAVFFLLSSFGPKKISRNNDVSERLWLESVVLQFARCCCCCCGSCCCYPTYSSSFPPSPPLPPPRVVKIFCQLDRPFECCFLEAPRKIDMALGQLVSLGQLELLLHSGASSV